MDEIPLASLSAEPAPPTTVADRQKDRFVSTRTLAKDATGSAGVLTWPSVSGLPSVRTTQPMATPGLTSHTSTPAVVPSAGLVFRNTWAWPKETPPKPELKQVNEYTIQVTHEKMDSSFLQCSTSPAPSYPPERRGAAPEPVNDEGVAPTLMFTENETNLDRLYDVKNKNGFAKDAFHDEIMLEHRMEKDRAKAVKKMRMVTKSDKKMVKGPSTPKAHQHAV
ncbi:hypothetical protein A4X13_0g7772 [Tilletia indica]|uniref:Uncharacterized protein n=1 Tax=Tilletia indica TaxID=43049 RepID=A0A8T8SHC3_9BASI|nr:hypothetical protein A4X13_0g7772 [Tilletia indica]